MLLGRLSTSAAARRPSREFRRDRGINDADDFVIGSMDILQDESLALLHLLPITTHVRNRASQGQQA
jgi:hypothetical protein